MAINKHSLLVVIGWLVIVGYGLWFASTELKLTTNVGQFMPEARNKTDQFLLDQLNTGTASRILLMAVSGPEHANLGAASQQFTQALRETQHFKQVNNGVEVLDEATRDLLFRYRYLLSPTVDQDRFSLESLRQTFLSRYRELSSPITSFDKTQFSNDPTREFVSLLASYDKSRNAKEADGETNAKISARPGVWLSKRKDTAFILAETTIDGFDLDRQQQLQADVKGVFVKLGLSPDSTNSYKLQMTGPGVIAVNMRQQIRDDVRTLTLTASIIVICLLVVVFRSVLVVILSVLPLLTAMLVATVCTGMFFEEVHGITLAFGLTIIGVAIDYPIHVFSHLSGKAGAGGENSIDQNIKRIWPTLRLGVITSCSGYLSMLASDFSGLTQLVVFSISGLLAAMLVTRWVIPAILSTRSSWSDINMYISAWLPENINRSLLAPKNTYRVLAYSAGVIGFLYIMLSTGSPWQNDITALSPIPVDALVLDRKLRDGMGVADYSHLIVVEANNVDDVLVRNERVTEVLESMIDGKVLKGFDSVSYYLPSQSLQIKRQSVLPEREILMKNLDAALAGLPFKRDLLKAFVDDVQAAKQLPPLLHSELGSSLVGLKLDSLLIDKEGNWLSVVPLSGVAGAAGEQAIIKVLKEQELSFAHYINIKSATNRLVSGFRDQTLQRTAWAVLIILAVMWLGLRSVPRVMQVILPVLLAIVATVAILMMMGQSLSLFNLVALLLVFGIGVDYSLFFNRRETDRLHRVQTLHSLMVCAISTVSVFGILSLSEIPVLQDIGETVAVGVLVCFFMSMAISQSREQSREQPSE